MTNPERKLLAATYLRRSIRNQTDDELDLVFCLIGEIMGLDRLAVSGTLQTRTGLVDDYEAAMRDGRIVEERV